VATAVASGLGWESSTWWYPSAILAHDVPRDGRSSRFLRCEYVWYPSRVRWSGPREERVKAMSYQRIGIPVSIMNEDISRFNIMEKTPKRQDNLVATLCLNFIL
jgi:hypothetical protein